MKFWSCKVNCKTWTINFIIWKISKTVICVQQFFSVVFSTNVILFKSCKIILSLSNNIIKVLSFFYFCKSWVFVLVIQLFEFFLVIFGQNLNLQNIIHHWWPNLNQVVFANWIKVLSKLVSWFSVEIEGRIRDLTWNKVK